MADEFQQRFSAALNDRLARQSADRCEIRALGLSTLVDLFVEGARRGRTPPPHFGELMRALLPGARVEVRSDVARRLAHCEDVPGDVAAMLAGDELAVAAPVLRQSPALSGERLAAIAASGPADRALLIAARADLPPEAISALIDRADPAIGDALATRPGTELDADAAARIACLPGLGETAAGALARHDGLARKTLERLFWAADTAGRRHILRRLASLAESLTASMPGLRRQVRVAGDRLFGFAAARRHEELAAHLADGLSLSPDLARRIATHRGGEALAVAARAGGLSGQQMTGLMLLAVPEAATSYDALRDLVILAEDLDQDIAAQIVDWWREAEGEQSRPTRHDPAVARPPDQARRGADGTVHRLPQLGRTPARPRRHG